MNVTIASRLFAPEEHRNNYGAQMAIDMAVGRSRLLARQLKTTPYLAGATFTAADISCSYFLGFADSFGFTDRLDPALFDYYERLKSRPAYGRAIATSARMTGKDA